MLGLLFFAAFPILFNASLIFTTAARGALALSTLPLLTMVVGWALGIEPLTARKTVGVLVAISGVSMALLSGLATAPVGAWRGDTLMVVAALCMALYPILKASSSAGHAAKREPMSDRISSGKAQPGPSPPPARIKARPCVYAKSLGQ